MYVYFTLTVGPSEQFEAQSFYQLQYIHKVWSRCMPSDVDWKASDSQRCDQWYGWGRWLYLMGNPRAQYWVLACLTGLLVCDPDDVHNRFISDPDERTECVLRDCWWYKTGRIIWYSKMVVMPFRGILNRLKEWAEKKLLS